MSEKISHEEARRILECADLPGKRGNLTQPPNTDALLVPVARSMVSILLNQWLALIMLRAMAPGSLLIFFPHFTTA